MKGSAPHFSAPLDTPRPRGARLLEGFSPKLSRRVRLYDRVTFNLWISLEADPTIQVFCEHPARLGNDAKSPLIEFWVQRGDREEFFVLERGASPPALPDRAHDVAVSAVTVAELAAAGVWISNWQRILPVITATHALIPKSLSRSVLGAVREPTPLSQLEYELAVGDPALVRGAVFELLRTGRLCAPGLRTQLLSMHTMVEPAQ
jgi:hypothetical protein